MGIRHILSVVMMGFGLIAGVSTPTTAGAQMSETSDASRAAFQEMRRTLGMVPVMFRLLPDDTVAGAWQEMKSLQLSTNTAIPSKYKELIGAAVAAQIPCHYCSYFHRRVAMDLNGASDVEFREAVATAALTRHWSTVLNGINQDMESFRRDVDRMYRPATMERAPASMTETTAKMSPPARNLKNADEVYREARRLWGFAPQFIREFPRESVAGAWNEYVSLYAGPSVQIAPKYKALISLAVASQMPCNYCVIMDKAEAKREGANDREIREAIAMAALTRHWSTVLNGNLIDEAGFRTETDQIIQYLKTPRGPAFRGPASVPAEEPDASSEE